jgi:peptidoglycan/xylan/chitin deacetylase (PgdA/CDA1 family)
MNIYLTYDYELFFGTNTGTISNCLLQPTKELLAIANAHNAKITLFVDAGFLYTLQLSISKYPQLKWCYEQIQQQLLEADAQGHSIQLHVHPHWEDSFFDGEKWIMHTMRYKLADFNTNEAERIIINYTQALQQCTHSPITAFRAGGWCAQPFSLFSSALHTLGITTDSSVFVGGNNTTAPYEYNYSNAPQQDSWRFSNDVTTVDGKGIFTELPIASYKYSPFFYWNLFVRGKLNKPLHTTIGKGYPIAQVGFKSKVLTKGMLFCACSDGFYASKLSSIISTYKQYNHFVIIGHPKAQSLYSIKATEEFILQQIAYGNDFVAMR